MPYRLAADLTLVVHVVSVVLGGLLALRITIIYVVVWRRRGSAHDAR